MVALLSSEGTPTVCFPPGRAMGPVRPDGGAVVHAVLEVGAASISLHTLAAVDRAVVRLLERADQRQVAETCRDACSDLEIVLGKLKVQMGVDSLKVGKAVAFLRFLELGGLASRLGKLSIRRRAQAHPDASFVDELCAALDRVGEERIVEASRHFLVVGAVLGEHGEGAPSCGVLVQHDGVLSTTVSPETSHGDNNKVTMLKPLSPKWAQPHSEAAVESTEDASVVESEQDEAMPKQPAAHTPGGVTQQHDDVVALAAGGAITCSSSTSAGTEAKRPLGPLAGNPDAAGSMTDDERSSMAARRWADWDPLSQVSSGHDEESEGSFSCSPPDAGAAGGAVACPANGTKEWSSHDLAAVVTEIQLSLSLKLPSESFSLFLCGNELQVTVQLQARKEATQFVKWNRKAGAVLEQHLLSRFGELGFKSVAFFAIGK